MPKKTYSARPDDPRWLVANLRGLVKYAGMRREHHTRFVAGACECVVHDAAVLSHLKDAQWLKNVIAHVVTTIGVQSRCKDPLCNADVYMLHHRVTGRKVPYTIHGLCHFADCRSAESFRKRAARSTNV